LALGALVILIHLFFGELALKTPDFKRLPGFAKIYLGNWGQIAAYTSTILGIFGALLAYLIVGGEFLTELFLPIFGGSSLVYTLFYFVIAAALIFFGIKAIAKVEFWGLVLFFIILFAIFFQGKLFITIENLFPSPDISYIFLPYGIILFSLWGAALIPEVEEMLGKEKNLLLKIIPIAILIPMVVYLFFIYLILGITGTQTTESALTGLRNVLGDGIVSLALIFGLLTTFTSFITLGLTLKKVFWYDLKIGKNIAFAITCFIPLVLFLIGIKQFIPIISFVGATMLGIDGILILLMYRTINPKNLLVFPLILVFFAGIIYEIIYFIR
ncbi:MAG: aromatic amino acid transport family protein, partial [bacterium]|nr:aromatic amino acid transport family protein [bacterium]